MAWPALAIALALLAGCATSESTTTRFYVLDALPGDSAALSEARREPPIAVDIAALRLPQYLERPQIVTRSARNELALAEYHQWGGNLAKNVTRVLARNLALLLGTAEITVFSRRPPTPADVRVEIDVMQFERGPDRRVLLSAQWRLRAGADGTPHLARISERVSEPLDAAAGMDATVAAMSALLGELSREIARAVAEQAR
jgi:hypothetical protein